jgi:hypothetical protein
MSKYGIEIVGGCVETKKDLKRKLKVEKAKLKDFIEIADNVDMNWEHKQQMTGALYLEIVRLKRRLKEH